MIIKGKVIEGPFVTRNPSCLTRFVFSLTVYQHGYGLYNYFSGPFHGTYVAPAHTITRRTYASDWFFVHHTVRQYVSVIIHLV